jgi:hypothetical protein
MLAWCPCPTHVVHIWPTVTRLNKFGLKNDSPHRVTRTLIRALHPLKNQSVCLEFASDFDNRALAGVQPVYHVNRGSSQLPVQTNPTH